MHFLRRLLSNPFHPFIALVASLALLWLFVVPPFQGADESVHVGQSTLWLSWIQDGFEQTPEARTECQKNLLRLLKEHRVASLRHNPLSSYAAPLLRETRRESYLYDFGCKQGLNLPIFGLYYLVNVPLLVLTDAFDPLVQFYVLRIVSLAVLLAFFVVAYRFGQLVFKEAPLTKQAFLFPLLLALHPLLLIVGVSISYDGLTNLWFALCFFISFGFLMNQGPFAKPSRFIWGACVVSVLALFTKMVGPLVPLFFLVSALFSKRFSVRTLLLFTGLLLPLSLWVLVGLSGYHFPIDEIRAILTQTSFSQLFYSLFIARWSIAFESFWGGWGVGWLDVYAPPPFLLLFAAFLVIGFFAGVWGYFKKFSSQDRLLFKTSFFCVLLFETIAILYNLFFPQLVFPESGFSQGRYYFPLLFPLFYMVLKGWEVVLPQRFQRIFTPSLVWLLVIYHFIYLGFIILPRFYL